MLRAIYAATTGNAAAMLAWDKAVRGEHGGAHDAEARARPGGPFQRGWRKRPALVEGRLRYAASSSVLSLFLGFFLNTFG